MTVTGVALGTSEDSIRTCHSVAPRVIFGARDSHMDRVPGGVKRDEVAGYERHGTVDTRGSRNVDHLRSYDLLTFHRPRGESYLMETFRLRNLRSEAQSYDSGIHSSQVFQTKLSR